MNEKQASAIREWRTVDNKSWRTITALTLKQFPELATERGYKKCSEAEQSHLDADVGFALCRDAAAVLKENHLKAPWN